MTVYDAICQTNWLDQQPFFELKNWIEAHRDDSVINPKAWYVGIFSKKCLLSDRLHNKDRVELYRKLSRDAMDNRKQKVLAKKKQQARLASQPKS